MNAQRESNPVTAYMRLYQQWLDGVMQVAREVTDRGNTNPSGKARKVACCPPDIECPPHCLMTLQRKATVGEVIVEAFAVRNCCGRAATYRLGVRPLLDQHGNPAPNQPKLDKDQVTLDMNQAVVVHLKLDTSGMLPGHRYSGEIVLREREVNQNICFTVELDSELDVPEVCLKEEAEYFNRFHSWEGHYYCERRPARLTINRNA